MKWMATIVLGGALLAGVTFGLRESAAQPAADGPERANTPPAAPAGPAAGGVRSITLPNLQPELPPGQGRETVAAGCILCHSTRYITGQPKFPRATWAASVDKMRKVYGAPIRDEQVPVIVDYLVAIRGAEEPTTRP